MRSVLSCSRNNVIFPQESGRAELSPAGSWGQGATGELEGSTWLLTTHPLQGCKVGPGNGEKPQPGQRGSQGWAEQKCSIQPTREQKMWDRFCTTQPEKEVSRDTNKKGL